MFSSNTIKNFSKESTDFLQFFGWTLLLYMQSRHAWKKQEFITTKLKSDFFFFYILNRCFDKDKISETACLKKSDFSAEQDIPTSQKRICHFNIYMPIFNKNHLERIFCWKSAWIAFWTLFSQTWIRVVYIVKQDIFPAFLIEGGFPIEIESQIR